MGGEQQGNYGDVTEASVQLMKLWWYSATLPSTMRVDQALTRLSSGSRDAAESWIAEALGVSGALKALDEQGVYAFDGCHDSRPTGGILYIGQAGAKKKPEAGRPLRRRISESYDKFAWAEGDRGGLYGDVWNVTLRWARVHNDHILGVERVLILAHAPSFNAQHVRGQIAGGGGTDLVILNGGSKGALLPVVAGHYFDKKLWEDPSDA